MGQMFIIIVKAPSIESAIKLINTKLTHHYRPEITVTIVSGYPVALIVIIQVPS